LRPLTAARLTPLESDLGCRRKTARRRRAHPLVNVARWQAVSRRCHHRRS
jgi:hypothetical protein